MNQDVKKILRASNRKVRLEAKRSVELWIYSFADMYMILVFFFIAMSALYAHRIKAMEKEDSHRPANIIPTAGRGPSVAETLVNLDFTTGSANILPSTEENLKILLPLVRSNARALLDIEGYADSKPLKSDSAFSSNLDLSNRRAVRVAEWFMAQGVPSSRLRTYAYGDGRHWGSLPEIVSGRRVVVKFYLREDRP
ncbi:MAG: OmpA family protein [Bdellovibrionales bacterium]|nr:OmpA family protein [Bdellovibrionales bacterium]